ncbi:MAG: hypothetical protein L3J36_08740 [Rhodobacteraceae bacterium]|nr:hypothetical protein [Paracoccaceae bacterium]
MSFIRPEIRAAIWRWREVLTGVAVGALGVCWVLGPGGLLGWLGWVLVIAGVSLVVIGVQRARFRGAVGGVGVVQVDEGQVSYFGPLTGGSAAMSDLARLSLDPRMKPKHWVLEQPGQPPLYIPINAEGVDALFDVFAALPGLKTERMLSGLGDEGTHPIVIWQKTSTQGSVVRLH